MIKDFNHYSHTDLSKHYIPKYEFNLSKSLKLKLLTLLLYQLYMFLIGCKCQFELFIPFLKYPSLKAFKHENIVSQLICFSVVLYYYHFLSPLLSLSLSPLLSFSLISPSCFFLLPSPPLSHFFSVLLSLSLSLFHFLCFPSFSFFQSLCFSLSFSLSLSASSISFS